LVGNERQRADRVRQPFAVLAFEPQGAPDLARFWEVLRSRIRSTDALGRLPDGRPSVLLRGTTVESAMEFAGQILQTLEDHGNCTVHGYPPFEYGLRAGWRSSPASERVLAGRSVGELIAAADFRSPAERAHDTKKVSQ
jgi:GGDEF domain-containing protein